MRHYRGSAALGVCIFLGVLSLSKKNPVKECEVTDRTTTFHRVAAKRTQQVMVMVAMVMVTSWRHCDRGIVVELNHSDDLFMSWENTNARFLSGS